MTKELARIMKEGEDLSLYDTLVRAIDIKYPVGVMAWVESHFLSLTGRSRHFLSLPAVQALSEWDFDKIGSLQGVGNVKAKKIQNYLQTWKETPEGKSAQKE